MQEISPQYDKDKPQGIRGIWHKGAGEQGMGMAAGTALVTLYSYFMCDWGSACPFHQVTRIGGKRGQTGFCVAGRADPICMGEAFCFLFKLLPVRKRNLVQLAKTVNGRIMDMADLSIDPGE